VEIFQHVESQSSLRIGWRVIPPEPVQQQINGDFSQHDAERPLQLHNLARANRRCKKLEWDENLARDAESYAQTMASTGVVEHSDVGAQGENLFVSTGDASFEDAVDSWLNEEKKYHGEHIGEGNLADWGHFTQAIWHATTHLGMGKARSKSGHTYIVGRYSPAGNVRGEKPYEDGDSTPRS